MKNNQLSWPLRPCQFPFGIISVSYPFHVSVIVVSRLCRRCFAIELLVDAPFYLVYNPSEMKRGSVKF